MVSKVKRVSSLDRVESKRTRKPKIKPRLTHRVSISELSKHLQVFIIDIFIQTIRAAEGVVDDTPITFMFSDFYPNILWGRKGKPPDRELEITAARMIELVEKARTDHLGYKGRGYS